MDLDVVVQEAGTPVNGAAAPAAPAPPGGHSSGYYLARILPPVLGVLAIILLAGLFLVVSFIQMCAVFSVADFTSLTV